MATNTKTHIKSIYCLKYIDFHLQIEIQAFRKMKNVIGINVHWNKNYAFARNQAKKTSSSND